MAPTDSLWVVPITAQGGKWKINTLFAAPDPNEAQALCHEHMAQLHRMIPGLHLNVGEARPIDIRRPDS